MSTQKLNFASKFSQNEGFLATSFVFLENNLSTSENFVIP